MNNGHAAEFREMLPSTSKGMEGIVTYRNVHYCYDVFDPKGDGDDQVMGVQYYIAFRHTKAREGKWYQNLKLYEAPYAPQTLQFYTIKGVDPLSEAGMDFNRELRRVGYGYTIDRAKLFLQ